MKWWRRKARERDLQREIESHLSAEADDLIERGIAHEAAQFAARRRLGNATLIQEDTRAVWGWPSIERALQDLRYALRLLRKSRAFTLTAIASLAIGIGMNTAIFSLVDAVLLRKLPVRSPGDLILIAERTGSRQSFSLSTPLFRALSENDTLTGLAAFRPWRFRTTVHGEPRLANGQLVSGEYFSVLGLGASLGRTIGDHEDQAVAVLSYRYWRREFEADPNVIGRSLEIQGHQFTVVGVTAREFSGLEPGREVDITVPLAMQPAVMPGTPLLDSPNARWLRVIGRRRAGVPLDQVRANLAIRWAHLPAAEGSRLEVLPGSQGLYDLRREFSLPLQALMASVAVVLLVACTNLASLLLARAKTRQQEIALRMSLGASRGRLLSQLLTESVLLSVMGGSCGLALAWWGCQLLVEMMSHGGMPIVLDLSIHTRTLIFTTIVSIGTGLFFGVVPALRATSAANAHGSRLIGGRPSRWTAGLIVAQVSLCLTLLVSSGLLLSSLRNLHRVDPGFREDHVLLMSIRPAVSNYDSRSEARLYRDLYQQFSKLTGVQSVTLSMDTPLGGVSYTAGASLVGQRGQGLEVNVNSIGPRFFDCMGIPLLMGRDVTLQDDDRAPPVAVISESVAHRLFPGMNPIGRRIEIGESAMEIVGVAKDTRYQSLREPVHPTVYRPFLQMPGRVGLFFGIRTVGDPAKMANVVRRALHDLAPDVLIFSLSTLEEQVDATLVQERMLASLSVWFGGFTLLLSAIGIYGRFAYAVVEGTREIGIRLALGAPRSVVMFTILREAMVLLAWGVAIGLPLALVSARLIRGVLYGLAPHDPWTLAAAALAIVAVAALACYIPARRASRIDPMLALRYE